MANTPSFSGRMGQMYRAFCLSLGLVVGSYSCLGQTVTITNAADVMALSAEEASEGRPVQIEGVIISKSAPTDHALIVADSSGGVYVLADNNILSSYNAGDLLSLTGKTDPGGFAPIIKVTRARRLGTAPLPKARPVTYRELISGALDAQWVEINGIVRQFFPPDEGSEIGRILVSSGVGVLHVRVTDPHDPELKEDAKVRLQALCFYQFNQKRQVLQPVLQVPPGIPIVVEKPAPSDPFATPVRSSASLRLFSPQNAFGHRVHVRGVVTHSQPGSFIWIRDGSDGLRLQVRSTDPVHPGDVLDVLGFPKYGTATPILEDAIFRKLGTTNSPPPEFPNSTTNAFDHDDDLVSLEATLSLIEPTLDGLILSLISDDVSFTGVLKLDKHADKSPNWRPGSRVRVVGICSVAYDDARPLMGIWHPASFQLLLRSPADVVVLQAPSWWTVQHIAYLFATGFVLLLLGTGSMTLLTRKRLREQDQQRAMAEKEFAAILSERNRVAREIHDSLAQGLAATSVQLRLARRYGRDAGETLLGHLDTALELVRDSLQEARNSIWNMRPQVLETGDLQTALQNILNQMVDGTDVKAQFDIAGHPRRLAPIIENNALRVGQEAITNATKHARANTISVKLDFGDKLFQLVIKDDGIGFDVQHPPASEGGFGLVGMRARAAGLNGDLSIHSNPNGGTVLTFNVPLRSD